MRRSALLGLEGGRHSARGNRRFDFLAARAHDENLARGGQGRHRIEQMDQHRLAGDRVKHLVPSRIHPRPLPRGKDDYGEREAGWRWSDHGAAHATPDAAMPVARRLLTVSRR